MTGGQMAPTTLLGQKTTTTPYGREFGNDGYPIRMSEMLATLEGTSFVARVALNNPANLMKARKAIRKAFQMQINEMGFSFVEIVLSCPTNWGLTSLEAHRRVEEELIPYFPLGIFKERKMADSL
jgi:2-oxoglutarate ferredoxin oxidoreductase subunit beta